MFQLMAFPYKTITGPKPLHISCNNIDGFISVRVGEFRHLLIFDYGLIDKIFDRKDLDNF